MNNYLDFHISFISFFKCLSSFVVRMSICIFANCSFIFHPIMLTFCRHVQNDLAQKRKLSKTGFGVKNFLKNFFSEKMTVFANYSFIFHLILLKFYRHVQNDLAQKCKFSKMGFGVQKFSKKFFF